MLFCGERLGCSDEPQVDIAVDPLDGTTLVSQGRNGAIAVIAVAERNALFDPGPCMYMEKVRLQVFAVIRHLTTSQLSSMLARIAARTTARTAVAMQLVVQLAVQLHCSLYCSLQHRSSIGTVRVFFCSWRSARQSIRGRCR